jgi:hypothetical protein
MKLSLRTNLVLNWLVLSFPERFQPIVAAMCTITINVLELMHLMLSPNISYFYSIEFYDFADNIQERMKHQIGGCNSGRTGHDFLDNSIIHFLSFIVRTRTLLKMWKSVWFSNWLPGENLGGSNLQYGSLDSWHLWFSLTVSHWEPSWEPSWKPTSGFSQWVRTAQHSWAPWEEAFP